MRAAPIVALAVALAACGRDRPSVRDQCRARKDLFLLRAEASFADLTAKAPPAERKPMRALLDDKLAFARAHFDEYCDTVTDTEWACVNAEDPAGRAAPGCYAASSRLGKVLFDVDPPLP